MQYRSRPLNSPFQETSLARRVLNYLLTKSIEMRRARLGTLAFYALLDKSTPFFDQLQPSGQIFALVKKCPPKPRELRTLLYLVNIILNGLHIPKFWRGPARQENGLSLQVIFQLIKINFLSHLTCIEIDC